MSVLVISPHRDDAAFSCGCSLANVLQARTPVRIANICTVSDYAPYAAANHAPDSVAQITGLRAAEDAAFLELLQCLAGNSQQDIQLVDLGWADAPLRLGIPTEDVLAGNAVAADEVTRLAAAFGALSAVRIVLVPLGLGAHLDHRLAHAAALFTWPAHQIVFYEDLPYACRMPPQTRAEQTSSALPWTCLQANLQPAQAGTKRRMALCYSSQIALEVAEEMEGYGAALGFTERLYGSEAALGVLARLAGTTPLLEDKTL